ncbi:MAG: sugar ABC transporter substrate-binding protein [Candidatus Limiplasma sp.]|nr:sugar ABC transporter substrate-binding protein [Candidatus Limiplasma sp.]
MKKLTSVLMVVVLLAGMLTLAATAFAEDDFYAVSLGWAENASGQRQKTGFTESFEKFGITNFSIVDANYDPVRQTEQIRAFIAKAPKALFITPSDPTGIAEAVKEACDAGIPVYLSDGFVSGADAVSTVLFDNYACGKTTMTYLCDRLQEKYGTTEPIKIGMIMLPSNESWHQRDLGAEDVLEQEKYANIQVANTWSWDSTGAVTPSATISTWLAADTNKELRGIWCAWDGAAFEGLVLTGETRPEIMYTGCDGGEECWNYMINYPESFVMSAGENIYSMPRQLVQYAMNYHEGRTVPRLVLVEGYAVTSTMIGEVNSIRDYKVGDKTAWELLLSYDLPGNIDLLNQALTENNLTDHLWVPTI